MFRDGSVDFSSESARWYQRLRLRGGLGRRTLYGVAVLVVAIGLYYLIGGLWVHRIDDDTGFVAPTPIEGGSRAVDLAAALIGREVDVHGWTANDPFFQPGWVLDNMPLYQQGIIYALGRFAIEMADQIGRARGSSQVDADLDRAAGLLKYPGDIWIFDFSTSWAPTASSDQQYRAAQRALVSYNQRLAAGQAVFDRRSDNLIATLDRIAADLGSASAVIDRHIDASSGWLIDTRADDIFYATKGRIYAYYLLLRELGVDFEVVIQERGLTAVWQQALDSFREAAELQPWVIINGRPDSQFLPSHLAAQGFYLLRARTQLREISNVLTK